MSQSRHDEEQIGRMLAVARELLGADTAGFDVSHADPRARLTSMVTAIRDALSSGAADPEPLVAIAVQAQDLLHAIHVREYAQRVHLQAQVHAALERLRGASSSSDLLNRVCGEAVRSCGLRRVLLSRVEDDVWFPWMARFDGTQAQEDAFLAESRTVAINIADSPAELRVLRERRPALIRSTKRPPLLNVVGAGGYVVAPIAPAGRVVGLLHADHYPEELAVDAVDRDVLWTFAEGFGRIYERMEILDRLRSQRTQAHDALSVVDSITSAIDRPEIELTRVRADRTSDHDPLLSIPARPDFEGLLTQRERDVFVLLIRGLNNAAIAERLVIREGTVKGHVKQILRKVGAANRAEAIGLAHGFDFEHQTA